MDLEFTPDDLAFREAVRALIAQAFPQHDYDGSRDHEERWRKAMASKGWSVNKWPVEFGGPGWSPSRNFIWERETTAAGLPPQIGGMGMGMLAPILFGYGSKEQQERFLPDILENRVRWCQGYSEPGSGSDLASLRTKATLEGDHYVVQGEKVWTSGAHTADWMFCLTRTSMGNKPQAGITFLLIDMKSPGVSIIPIISLDGTHPFNRVVLDEVKVPVANRIGIEGEGWTYAKGLLTHERTGQAFVSLSLDMVARIRVAASQVPGSVGATLMDDPGFAGRVALAEIELKALEMTELRTLWEVQAGSAPGAQSSMLKLKGTDIVQRMTEFFVECAGPYAAPWFPKIHGPAEHPGPSWVLKENERYYEARAASIAGGTDEIQRNIIAKQVLRL